MERLLAPVPKIKWKQQQQLFTFDETAKIQNGRHERHGQLAFVLARYPGATQTVCCDVQCMQLLLSLVDGDWDGPRWRIWRRRVCVCTPGRKIAAHADSRRKGIGCPRDGDFLCETIARMLNTEIRSSCDAEIDIHGIAGDFFGVHYGWFSGDNLARQFGCLNWLRQLFIFNVRSVKRSRSGIIAFWGIFLVGVDWKDSQCSFWQSWKVFTCFCYLHRLH